MKTIISILAFLISVLFVGSFFTTEDVSPANVYGVTALVIGALSLMVPGKEAGYLFETIAIQDARGIATKKLIAVYDDTAVTVTTFFTSFFKRSFVRSKNVSIETVRGLEKKAANVFRGGRGVRNTFNKAGEKIFTPPFYYEYFLLNELDLYDNAIGRGDLDSFTILVQDGAKKLEKLRNKIERAVEHQCVQALLTGVITLEQGYTINFEREADSLVDGGAGTYWDQAGVKPLEQLDTGAEFIRNTGKYAGTVFNAILGKTAHRLLMAKIKAQNQVGVVKVDLGTISAPQRNAVGATLHGMLHEGNFTYMIWTYDGHYQDDDGNIVTYMEDDKVILLPETTNFHLPYALVPQLIDDGQVPQTDAYLIQEFIDIKAVAHEIAIKAAPLAILTAVDQVWTAKVAA